MSEWEADEENVYTYIINANLSGAACAFVLHGSTGLFISDIDGESHECLVKLLASHESKEEVKIETLTAGVRKVRFLW